MLDYDENEMQGWYSLSQPLTHAREYIISESFIRRPNL
jgi:hypothetical protein